jgi:hypothetical protein
MAHPCKEPQTVGEAKELTIPPCGREGECCSYLPLLKMNGTALSLIAHAITHPLSENLELLKYDTSLQNETRQAPHSSNDDNLKPTEPNLANEEDKWSTTVIVDASELLEAPPPPPQPRLRPRPPLSPILNCILPTFHPAVDLDALPDISLRLQILDDALDASLDLQSHDS